MAILDEYQQLTEADPAFDPVRPVMVANVRAPERETAVPLITDPLTARVTDLFNVGYEILLQMFERFFAHTQESDAELKVLADATVALMLRVIKPLGDLITTLPAGDDYPGLTAGPSFELFYESDYLMPHKEAAWALLAERLDEAAWLCDAIRSGRGTAIAGGWSRSCPRCGTSRGHWPRACPSGARTPGSRPRRPAWSGLTSVRSSAGRTTWPPRPPAVAPPLVRAVSSATWPGPRTRSSRRPPRVKAATPRNRR